MPYAALADLIAAADLDADPQAVDIRGADPVFVTPFRIGAAGAAAIAACALAADEHWRQRNGESGKQAIAVDVRQAAAAMRSARYMQIDGSAPKELFDPLSGLYEAQRERWIYLHCNFQPHRAAALRVLGLSAAAGKDAIVAAVRERDAMELEDAVHAAGGCAGLVRTRAQWAQHPQSAALATVPLIEIQRIGDAPREPLPAAARPLSGVRVLDLTRVLAGPTCARTLAEHGADVLKISGSHLPHSGVVEIDTGLGKRSAFLDLRRSEELAALRALIAAGRCDVFSQSYRPGTLPARGLGPQALAQLRPGIVCVDLSAWSRAGPWSRRRGFDTVAQCVSGMAVLQGSERAPRTLPVSAIDYVSGYLMAFGAMVALTRRAREGGSWHVQVSLARTGQWIVERGLLDAAALSEASSELPQDYLAHITQCTPSVLGEITHLAPVAQMSVTPPRWERPPVPLGHDAAQWLPREA